MVVCQYGTDPDSKCRLNSLWGQQWSNNDVTVDLWKRRGEKNISTLVSIKMMTFFHPFSRKYWTLWMLNLDFLFFLTEDRISIWFHWVQVLWMFFCHVDVYHFIPITVECKILKRISLVKWQYLNEVQSLLVLSPQISFGLYFLLQINICNIWSS